MSCYGHLPSAEDKAFTESERIMCSSYSVLAKSNRGLQIDGHARILSNQSNHLQQLLGEFTLGLRTDRYRLDIFPSGRTLVWLRTELVGVQHQLKGYSSAGWFYIVLNRSDGETNKAKIAWSSDTVLSLQSPISWMQWLNSTSQVGRIVELSTLSLPAIQVGNRQTKRKIVDEKETIWSVKALESIAAYKFNEHGYATDIRWWPNHLDREQNVKFVLTSSQTEACNNMKKLDY